MPVDFLPEHTGDPFPLKSYHLTKALLPNTEQVSAPSDFQISDFLTSGDEPLPLWLPSQACLLSIHVPFFGKKTQTKPSSSVWNTPPFVPSGHVVSLAPGPDPETRPGQGVVPGSVMGLSVDQTKPGTLPELLEKRCSPSFTGYVGGWRELIALVSTRPLMKILPEDTAIAGERKL